VGPESNNRIVAIIYVSLEVAHLVGFTFANQINKILLLLYKISFMIVRVLYFNAY